MIRRSNSPSAIVAPHHAVKQTAGSPSLAATAHRRP